MDVPEKRKGKKCGFNIFNKNAQVYINLFKNKKMFNLTKETYLAESCNYLVVVNTGKYICRVCQIPNQTLSYRHGTAQCDDVKYLAKI
jgi:hypothetical protein